MGGVAFLFAGQGAQHPAMGVDLIEASPAAAEVFAIADEVRPGTSEQCRSASKEELSADREHAAVRVRSRSGSGCRPA